MINDRYLQDFVTTHLALPGLNVVAERAPPTNGGLADALVEIESEAGAARYVVEAKRSVTTTTLPAILAQLRRISKSFDLPPLLMASYLTPGVTERLLAEGLEFADAAGNIYLDSPAAYVLVLGKRPERAFAPGGFTKTDLKLIFAFLARPSLRTATYRDIRQATGVSLGQISNTVAALETSGFAFRNDRGERVFSDAGRLLERWDFGYLEQVRPDLLLRKGRLGPDADLEALAAEARTLPDVLIGGEVAAAALTDYLQPATLTLHLPAARANEVAMRLRLPQADRDADVFLFQRFQNQLDASPDAPENGLVHPILVRAELLALDDDRLHEVADRLLEQLIVPQLQGRHA